MLPAPKKAILNIKSKLSKPKFFVNDYDKDCLLSIIHFYNQVEEGMKLEYNDYYILIMLIVRYEITNNNLINQIHEINNEPIEKLSIKDILARVDKLVNKASISTQEMEVIMASHLQKRINNDIDKPKGINENTDSLDDLLKYIDSMYMSENQTKNLIKMIKDFTSFIVMKKSSRKSKPKKR